MVYEPALEAAEFFSSPVLRDLATFKIQVDVIAANRMTDDIRDLQHKV